MGGDELRNDGLRDHRLGGGQVSFLPGQFGTVTAGVLDPIQRGIGRRDQRLGRAAIGWEARDAD